MNKLHRLFLALAAVVSLGGIAHAQSTGIAPAPAELADGEVRKVDRDNRKITLKHGPLKNLDMPGMTMVFQVREPAMLDKVQAGDKVRFLAENVSGKLTVVRLEPAR